MIHILELFAVICVTILPPLTAVVFWKQLGEDWLQRSPYINAVLKLIQSLAGLSLILYIAMQSKGGLLSIGIDFAKYDYLFGGIVVFSIFVLVYVPCSRMVLKRELKQDYTRADCKNMLRYKTPGQRIFQLINLTLGVIDEELVFRGYLILLWGHRTDAVIPCAIVSSLIFIVLHLYQGKATVIFHILFAIVLATVTITSGNIMLALGAHLYCNLLIQIKLWIADAKGKTEPEREPPPLPQDMISST